jgi:hypothetical protein
LQKHTRMEENRKVILDLLLNKSALKQNIADDCEQVFITIKDTIKKEIDALQKKIKDQRIRLSYKEKGNYEMHVFVGSDVLVFHLHNNVFRLPDDNALWGTKYLRENDANGYFGVIYIYNFLAESFLQNRLNDSGYLIGRLFINHERHFMMEGKGQLGVMFRDLENTTLSDDLLCLIVQSSFAYALEFDLLVPPYEYVAELSVGEIQLISNNLQLQTGKRLGFKMKSDESDFF